MTRYLLVADARRLPVDPPVREGALAAVGGEDFIQSFPSPEDALKSLNTKKVMLPPGGWKAPPKLEAWRFAAGRLRPSYF